MKNKRFLSMLLCVALAVSCLAGMTVSASADDVVSYTVKNGDYLYKVCKNSGLDYYTCKSAIMILNGWSTETQCNRIIPGQTIILPVSNAVAATVKSSATSTSSKTESVTINGKTYSSSSTSTISTAANTGDSIAYYLVAYTVKSGDYIAKICSNLGTSYTAYKSIINSVNGLTSTKIYAGKVLYIPVSSAPSSGSFYAVMAHRVDTGETMTTICSTYGANASSTMTKGVNEGTNLNYLQAGQVVYIPVASSVIVTPTPTSSSSPSGPVTGTYSISFTSVQHGTPYAMVGSSEATGANSGKTVTIVSDADDGYAQKSVSVVRTDTKATVPVSDNTFTMPASNVKISVTYAASKTITKTKTTNGSFTTYVNGIESQTAAYGSRVFLEFSPKAGYTVESVSYVKASGGTAVTVNSDSDGDYYFNMPNYNIKVSVTFEPATYYNIKTGSAENCKISYTMDGVSLSSSYPKAAKGTTVVATITPESDYVVDTISVNGGAITTTKVKNNQYSFKMPAGDVTVSVTLKRSQVYEVVQKSVSGGTLTFYALRDGERVFTKYFYADETVYINPVADSKKELSSVTVKQSVGRVTLPTTTDAGEGCKCFKMPSDWVTVTPSWKDSSKVTYHIYDGELVNSSFKCYDESVYSSKKIEIYNATKGTTVRIVVTNPIPYGVKTLQVLENLGDGKYEALTVKKISEGNYTFTMPENNVTIRIIADKDNYVAKNTTVKKVLEYVNTDGSTADVASFNPGTLKILVAGTDVSESGFEVLEDTKVEIAMCNLKSGYEIKKVTATVGTSGTPKTIAADSNGKYYYTIQRSECEAGITFTVQVVAYKYEVQYSSPANGSYTISGQKGTSTAYYAGDTITIAGITSNSGYDFNKIIVDGVDQTVNMSGGSYKFTMPAYDVTTQVTFKEKAKTKAAISIESFEGADIYYDTSKTYYAGDKVDLILDIADVSKLKSIMINNVDCTTGKFIYNSGTIYVYSNYEIPSGGAVSIKLEQN